jgi:hypothetical protein
MSALLLMLTKAGLAAECDCKNSGYCDASPGYYVCVLTDQIFDWLDMEVECRKIVEGQPVITLVWVRLYYSECVHEPPLTCQSIVDPIYSNYREYLSFSYLDENDTCVGGQIL